MKVVYYKLKDCCLKIGSGATPKGGKSVYTDNGVSLVRSQNVYNLNFAYKGLAHINDDAAEKLRGVTVKEKDVLLNITGDSVARTCVVPNDVLPARVNQHVAIIRPKQSLNSLYLNYYLASPAMQGYLLNIASTGASRNAITKAAIEKLVVPVPEIGCQQQIANVLSAYDNLIENNNKRIKILEQMAENLYKEWFVRFRFPGHETTPLENGIPKGWKKAKISDLCKFLNGFAFKSEEYCDDGQYRVVTIKNVQDGKFDLDSVEYINTIPPRMPSYCKLSIGDILMSLTGNVGRICYVTTNNCLLNQRVCKIKSEYPWFTYSFFKQDSIFQTLCNIAYGTAQLNLSPVLAGKMKIILPSGTLQKEYEKKVSPIFSHQQSLIEQNQILIKQRDLLLPRLMSGKLAV